MLVAVAKCGKCDTHPARSRPAAKRLEAAPTEKLERLELPSATLGGVASRSVWRVGAPTVGAGRRRSRPAAEPPCLRSRRRGSRARARPPTAAASPGFPPRRSLRRVPGSSGTASRSRRCLSSGSASSSPTADASPGKTAEPVAAAAGDARCTCTKGRASMLTHRGPESSPRQFRFRPLDRRVFRIPPTSSSRSSFVLLSIYFSVHVEDCTSSGASRQGKR